MDYEKLGMRVRQQRMLCKITQEQLAERAGVSCSFIGHIERGEKKASIETLVALCNAMSVSPTSLLQDSLTDAVIKSQMCFDKENEALVNSLMQLVREHAQKNGGY